MRAVFSILLACSLSTLVACDDPKTSKLIDAPVPHDAAIDSPDQTFVDASCFVVDDTSPHEQIINACTDAQKIYKANNLPLLTDAGTLPPLP